MTETYALDNYKPGQWWAKELELLRTSEAYSVMTDDQRRSIVVASNFVDAVFKNQEEPDIKLNPAKDFIDIPTSWDFKNKERLDVGFVIKVGLQWVGDKKCGKNWTYLVNEAQVYDSAYQAMNQFLQSSMSTGFTNSDVSLTRVFK
jgi:hypothetical protein